MTYKKKQKENLLIATSSFDENKKFLIKKLKKNGFNIILNPYKRKLKKIELVNILNDKKISYIIAGLETYDKDVLESTNIKLISRVGSGINNIDTDFAKLLKIKVFSTPTAPVDAVAEITLGSMIALSRSLVDLNNSMKKNIWSRVPGSLLKDKYIVIVGYGKIGQRLHELLIPFKPNITIVDPFIKKKNLNLKNFNAAIKNADYVTFHVNSKKNLVNMSNIKNFKNGVFILNSSRGEIIEEDSLIYGLKSGIVKGAWIDTFIDEPYYGKLCKNNSVILTPHCGSYTRETRILMENEAVDNLLNSYL